MSESAQILYRVSAKDFAKIPGSPLAYSLSHRFFSTFDNETVETVSESRCGMNTGDNEVFIRYWFEISHEKFCYSCPDTKTFHSTGALYAPYNKGGQYRKWYGNLDYVIKFDKVHYKILSEQGNRLPSRQYYFRTAITWTDMSVHGVGFRYQPLGTVFDGSAAVVFADRENMLFLLGLLNTKYVQFLAKILNPTLHFKLGDYAKIPYVEGEDSQIKELVSSNVNFSRTDWDSFETSWDFRCHPLVRLAKRKDDGV